MLDCYGHHAGVAYDGEAALRLLCTGAFEITFPDENLPDIKTVLSHGRCGKRRFARGFPRFNDEGDAVSQGDIAGHFDVYLQKPFSCKALMQVIEDARCSSDANTRRAAWTNCCRRKRTQPIVEVQW